MRVATWNICGGIVIEDVGEGYFDQDKKKSMDNNCFLEIIKQIVDNKIDIIALQEVITTKSFSYVKNLAKATGLKYYRTFENSPCNLVENTSFGVAILSKYPIVSSKKQLFNNPRLTFKTSKAVYGSHDKGYIVAKIKVGDRFVGFASTQFLPFHRFNTNILDYKNDFLSFQDDCIKHNAIACGDFNCIKGCVDIKSALPKFVSKSNFVFDEITTIDNKRCDNIIIPKIYKFLDKRLIKSCSDHYLCIADFNF